MATITMRIRIRWWLWPYLWGVEAMCALTGLEPDWDKVLRMVERAVFAEAA